jgi:hypothetical protein
MTASPPVRRTARAARIARGILWFTLLIAPPIAALVFASRRATDPSPDQTAVSPPSTSNASLEMPR